MREVITGEELIDYLQQMLSAWIQDKDRYGAGDEWVKKDMDRMLACKDMVEALIHEPVNMGKDGTVTTGF